jgi:4-hydroxybenzoate polyprenyltransferase
MVIAADKINLEVTIMYHKAYGLLRSNKVLRIVVIVAFLLAALTPSVAAQEKSAESAWEFHIAPYLWAMSMDGNATVKGLDVDVDVGFSDI